MSYRQFLERSLDRRALAEKNRNAPEGTKFCNGFCFDYLPTHRFSGVHVICNDCRNRIHMAERMVEKNLATLETVRSNPLIIYQDTDGLQTHKRCDTCLQTKVLTDFEHNRCVCKSCRYLKATAKTKDKIQGYIHDIEKLKDDQGRLEAFLNGIAKDALILINTHYQVGRKATDNKSTIVLNILQHFRRLGDPSRCGRCGANNAAAVAPPMRKNEKRQEFIDSLDTTFETLEPMDPEKDMDRFNKDQLTMLARKAGLKFEQILRKHDLFALLNAFLVERRERREKERAEKELLEKGIEIQQSFPELIVDDHKFQKEPCFYIIRASNDAFKIGFDGVDINERFRTYRTSIPNMTVMYMVFSPKSEWIEESMLSRFHDSRVENNHEFISEVSVLELTTSVETLLRYCRIPHEVVPEEEIRRYNDSD
ncbi:hypothetical protein EBZ80_02210 [bacterium]|nr:hypothetical protein [bacterium]